MAGFFICEIKINIMSRPSKFTPALADNICERLVEGESLRAICRDKGMPSAGTVCRWLGVNDEFREQYTRARVMQAEMLADETVDIADNSTNDYMKRKGKDGQEHIQLNGENVQRSRLRVDARKWYASKLAPKKYGDKSSVEVTGADGKEIEFRNKSDDELNARILELASKIGKDRVVGASGGKEKTQPNE